MFGVIKRLFSSTGTESTGAATRTDTEVFDSDEYESSRYAVRTYTLNGWVTVGDDLPMALARLMADALEERLEEPDLIGPHGETVVGGQTVWTPDGDNGIAPNAPAYEDAIEAIPVAHQIAIEDVQDEFLLDDGEEETRALLVRDDGTYLVG